MKKVIVKVAKKSNKKSIVANAEKTAERVKSNKKKKVLKKHTEKCQPDAQNESELANTEQASGNQSIVSDDDLTIRRLADLTPLEYGRVARNEARALGVTVSDLNKAVAAEQKRATSPAVLGSRLLSDIKEVFRSKNVERMRAGEVFKNLCSVTDSFWHKLWLKGVFNARKMGWSIVLSVNS